MTGDALFEQGDPEYTRVYAGEAALVDASELIAEVMDEQKMSGAELARQLGVNRSEITARLAGHRNMTIRKLAETLCMMGWELQLRAQPRSTVHTSMPRPLHFRTGRPSLGEEELLSSGREFMAEEQYVEVRRAAVQ